MSQSKRNSWPVTPAGSVYQVMLPTGKGGSPEAHYVNASVTACSCRRGSRCPALRQVRDYLAAGGAKAGEPVASKKRTNGNGHIPDSCPVCGAAVSPEYFEQRRGWRCTAGGLAHYYQTTYGHLQAWFARPADERLFMLATPAEKAAMALTYPAGA